MASSVSVANKNKADIRDGNEYKIRKWLVLNGQVLFAIFAISIMFLCRFYKARELNTIFTNFGPKLRCYDQQAAYYGFPIIAGPEPFPIDLALFNFLLYMCVHPDHRAEWTSLVCNICNVSLNSVSFYCISHFSIIRFVSLYSFHFVSHYSKFRWFPQTWVLSMWPLSKIKRSYISW
jgi:hypothetical protein